jgi:hypothetical protein
MPMETILKVCIRYHCFFRFFFSLISLSLSEENACLFLLSFSFRNMLAWFLFVVRFSKSCSTWLLGRSIQLRKVCWLCREFAHVEWYERAFSIQWTRNHIAQRHQTFWKCRTSWCSQSIWFLYGNIIHLCSFIFNTRYRICMNRSFSIRCVCVCVFVYVCVFVWLNTWIYECSIWLLTMD